MPSAENPNDLPLPDASRVETWTRDKEVGPAPTTIKRGTTRLFDEGVTTLRPSLPAGADAYVEVPLDPPMPSSLYMVGSSVAQAPPDGGPAPAHWPDLTTQVVRRYPDRVLVRVLNQDSVQSLRWKVAVQVRCEDPAAL